MLHNVFSFQAPVWYRVQHLQYLYLKHSSMQLFGMWHQIKARVEQGRVWIPSPVNTCCHRGDSAVTFSCSGFLVFSCCRTVWLHHVTLCKATSENKTTNNKIRLNYRVPTMLLILTFQSCVWHFCLWVNLSMPVCQLLRHCLWSCRFLSINTVGFLISVSRKRIHNILI